MTTEVDLSSRERYHTLLSVIAKHTGQGQPVMAAARTVWTVAVAHGRLNHDEARRAVAAAVENDHAVRWTDTDGRACYALTVDGADMARRVTTPVYDDSDAAAIRDVLETEVSRPSPDTDIVAWANQHLGGLEA